MNDMRRLNAGLNLIKRLVKQPARTGKPWSRTNQREQLAAQPNPHTPSSRKA